MAARMVAESMVSILLVYDDDVWSSVLAVG